jgi:hypothetical protein
MGKWAYVRGERKHEKRILCLLRGSRQKKFSSVKFAGRFSAATKLFEGAEPSRAKRDFRVRVSSAGANHSRSRDGRGRDA